MSILPILCVSENSDCAIKHSTGFYDHPVVTDRFFSKRVFRIDVKTVRLQWVALKISKFLGIKLLVLSVLVVGGGADQGGVYPSMHWGRHPPPVDRILETCLWKHYLSAIMLRQMIPLTGKRCQGEPFEINTCISCLCEYISASRIEIFLALYSKNINQDLLAQ